MIDLPESLRLSVPRCARAEPPFKPYRLGYSGATDAVTD
jgi:hypothetical protein